MFTFGSLLGLAVGLVIGAALGVAYSIVATKYKWPPFSGTGATA